MNENNGLSADSLEWLVKTLTELQALSETDDDNPNRFQAGMNVAYRTALHLVTVARHS